jgi:uncharacterized phage-associated protein
MYKALEIANWFINRGVIEVRGDYGGEYVTPLKLQKLLYYAQGCYGAIKNKRLFEEDILHWVHGPVVAEVYAVYKGDSGIEEQSPSNIDVETEAILKEVYAKFGIFTAWALRDMTQRETPWKKTTMNSIIPYDSIIEYFAKKCVSKK